MKGGGYSEREISTPLPHSR